MSARADIIFNAQKCFQKLKKSTNQRVRKEAGVYMATVLEYLVAEILEVAGDATKQAKKRRITPRSIMLSVRSDEELSALTKKVHFAESGTIPFIAPVLLQKPLKRRKKNHIQDETMEEDVNNNEAGSSKFQ